jgi:hypothetical protein
MGAGHFNGRGFGMVAASLGQGFNSNVWMLEGFQSGE